MTFEQCTATFRIDETGEYFRCDRRAGHRNGHACHQVKRVRVQVAAWTDKAIGATPPVPSLHKRSDT
jgi:hypothetical protein